MKIQTQPFTESSNASLRAAEYTNDWPVVYILENGTEAYVGETFSAYSRLRQHKKDKRASRRELSKAHILIDEEFNRSAAQDIESKLIQYMAADTLFTLQNGNGGLTNHNYFDREKYTAKFEVLWTHLQELKLADKDLLQLRNLDLFKYSPYKALTPEQDEISRRIKANIESYWPATYLINGDAGTGKSVLATYLLKNLTQSFSDRAFKCALVVPMTSLRKTLKRVFSKVEGLSAAMVIGPNEVRGNHYDLLIVDEAHRLRRRKNLTAYGAFDKVNESFMLGHEGTQLDWILMSSDSQVLMFDENQTIMPGDIPLDTIKSLVVERYNLTSQLRVAAGDDYISFIDEILNAKPSSRKINSTGYDLRVFESGREMVEAIREKDQKHGLARVVAGYAWDWKTGRGEQDYDIEVDGLKLIWNTETTDWVNSRNAINEVGCIHTVQGYDLNYVGVIIGSDLKYDEVNHRLVIDPAAYKDKKGKAGVEDAEVLQRYIINIYKTLLTRGIMGTYIYAVDPALNRYLSKQVSSALQNHKSKILR